MEDEVVHHQVGHQRMECGAPFEWDHVTIRMEWVTCEECRRRIDERTADRAAKRRREQWVADSAGESLVEEAEEWLRRMLGELSAEIAGFGWSPEEFVRHAGLSFEKALLAIAKEELA